MSDHPVVPETAADREQVVHYRVADRVASVVLDAPRNRNALSRRLVAQLHEALARAEADPDVAVVLLRAEGRTFCSGADLAEAAEADMHETAATIVEVQRRILDLRVPVVARVQGAVRAGGIGIVAAADVALCSEDATFAFTEVRLGLAPAAISLTVLPRMTSRSAALSFLTGEVFDGLAAAASGLVTRSVPEDRLDSEVRAVCEAVAQGSPQGLAETKALLTRDLRDRVEARGPELAALSARLFGSEEARSAMRAFLDRSRGGRG